VRMDWTAVQEWHSGAAEAAAAAAAEVTCGDDLTVVRTAHGQLFSWCVSVGPFPSLRCPCSIRADVSEPT